MGFLLIVGFLFYVGGVDASFRPCSDHSAPLLCRESISPAKRYGSTLADEARQGVFKRFGVVFGPGGEVRHDSAALLVYPAAVLPVSRALRLADAHQVAP